MECFVDELGFVFFLWFKIKCWNPSAALLPGPDCTVGRVVLGVPPRKPFLLDALIG